MWGYHALSECPVGESLQNTEGSLSCAVPTKTKRCSFLAAFTFSFFNPLIANRDYSRYRSILLADQITVIEMYV